MMARLKVFAVALGIVAAAVGVLLATGVVSLRRGGEAQGDRLEGLGYISERFPEDQGLQGLTRHVEGDVDPEMLVLYTLMGTVKGLADAAPERSWDEVRLVDVHGEVVHRWTVHPFTPKPKSIAAARVMPDGSLLLAQSELGLARLDWSGRTMWARTMDTHHDISYDRDGTVLALDRRVIDVTHKGQPMKLADQAVALIATDGATQWRWMSDAFLSHPVLQRRLDAVVAQERGRADPFHLNSVEVIRRPDPKRRWKVGDLLVSLRNVNLIAIIDRASGRPLWWWGPGELSHQHSPTQTRRGTFLVFDNRPREGASRLLEVDPVTNTIVWRYRPGPGPKGLFSRTRGVVQETTRGHAIAWGSARGRIVIINRAGEVVWEYFAGERHEDRAVPVRGELLVGQPRAAAWAHLRANHG